MTKSDMVTIELEVLVNYDEDTDGTMVHRESQCQTKAPFAVQAWAEHVAWRQVCGLS